MLSILVLLALTFAALGLLYFVRFGTAVSANNALDAAALQASDVGLATASYDLRSLSAYPETLNMAGYPWYYVPTPTSSGPVSAPNWSSCVGASQCGSTSVNFSGYTFTVEFAVEPTGLAPQTLNGYETGGPTTRYRLYDTFVYVTASGPSNLNMNVEAALRKGG